jgi:hypothetical protein
LSGRCTCRSGGDGGSGGGDGGDGGDPDIKVPITIAPSVE